MIIYLQHDTIIERLMYSTSNGTGSVYRSPGSSDLVKDAGEYGTIPVSGYNEYLEITAVLDDNKTIELYSQNI